MVEQRLDKPLVTSSNLVPGTKIWSYSISVSMAPCHGAETGSIPVGTARVLPVLHLSLDRQGKAGGLGPPRVLLGVNRLEQILGFDPR